MTAIKYELTDGSYVVKHDGDRIGFVRQEADGRWKAVDTYMAWMRRYKTRARAGAALLKRWQDNQQ
jgi:hypothetical protein